MTSDSLLEITDKDIRELSDEQLQTLVARLCEAELSSFHLSPKGVTWGGDLKAPDGGIDVRVEASEGLSEHSFIPRPMTGFQVKATTMPKSKIKKEMCPRGNLRESIKELANLRGAYIIVSGHDSHADTELKQRQDAMRSAISGLKNASDLKTDFYDSNRVATWVRSHPAIVLWVRSKLGKSLHGWRGYENWSNPRHNEQGRYFQDEHVRFFWNSSSGASVIDQNSLPVIDGINKMRALLATPRSSVRLVGLSGTGKTRLAQSLFDEDIGSKPLNRHGVYYADAGQNLYPDPLSFARQIIALGKPAVLVIDNCSTQLHRNLTQEVSRSESQFSLLTIEYDIREDQPEETNVFRLYEASEQVIKQIIKANYQNISDVDIESIAKFSGGNSRIAIALADSIQRQGSISHLNSEELFERLFWQHHDVDTRLLRAAEVLSLVYSYDTDDTEAELEFLADLAEMSLRELSRYAAILKERGLLQERGQWQAVLPHAIANRLATRALSKTRKVEVEFKNSGSERLLLSFSRRLSYLHDSPQAQKIASGWLDEGLLSNLAHLDRSKIRLLSNIAPVVPEKVLEAVEIAARQDKTGEFLSYKNRHHTTLVKILRLIAYDASLFERSIDLMCRFAISESIEAPNQHKDMKDQVSSLFFLAYSGTLATPEQRREIIQKLTFSKTLEESQLGVEMLHSALSFKFRISPNSFEFGAHSRNYGAEPKNHEDAQNWFRLFVDLAAEIATSRSLVAKQAKLLLAEQFVELWIKAKIHDTLESAVKQVSQEAIWPEVWLAIQEVILSFQYKRITPPPKDEAIAIARLEKLEASIRPHDLEGWHTNPEELVRLCVFVDERHQHKLARVLEVKFQADDDTLSAIRIFARQLGKQLAQEPTTPKGLLKELLSADAYAHFLFDLGYGLASQDLKLPEIWQEMAQQLSLVEESKRNYNLLYGFVSALSERNSDVLESLLDDAVEDETLAIAFPILQAEAGVDAAGIDRLIRSLNRTDISIIRYEKIASLTYLDEIGEKHLQELINSVLGREDGFFLAFGILEIIVRGDKIGEARFLRNGFLSLGKQLLEKYQFASTNQSSIYLSDYPLYRVISASLYKDHQAVKIFCEKMAKAIASGIIDAYSYPKVLNTLFSIQQEVFLDVFLGGKDGNLLQYSPTASWGSEFDPVPASTQETITAVISWAQNYPEIRYPSLASAIKPFEVKGGGAPTWTTLAQEIISNTPQPILPETLDKLEVSIEPLSWTGNRSEILEERSVLVKSLTNHQNDIVASWAREREQTWTAAIEKEREKERQMSERFEW